MVGSKKRSGEVVVAGAGKKRKVLKQVVERQKEFTERKIKVASDQYVTIGGYKNMTLVNFRRFARRAPTKEGVALHPREYRKVIRFARKNLPSTTTNKPAAVGESGGCSLELRDGRIIVAVGGNSVALTRVYETKGRKGNKIVHKGIVLEGQAIEKAEKETKKIEAAIQACNKFLDISESDQSDSEEDEDDEIESSDDDEEDEEEEEEEEKDDDDD